MDEPVAYEMVARKRAGVPEWAWRLLGWAAVRWRVARWMLTKPTRHDPRHALRPVP